MKSTALLAIVATLFTPFLLEAQVEHSHVLSATDSVVICEEEADGARSASSMNAYIFIESVDDFSAPTMTVPPFFYAFGADVAYYPGLHWSDEKADSYLDSCLETADLQLAAGTRPTSQSFEVTRDTSEIQAIFDNDVVVGLRLPENWVSFESASSTYTVTLEHTDEITTQELHTDFVAKLGDFKSSLAGSEEAGAVKGISVLGGSSLATSTIIPESAINLLGAYIHIKVSDDSGRRIREFNTPLDFEVFGAHLIDTTRDTYGFYTDDSGTSWTQLKWSEAAPGVRVDLNAGGYVSLWTVDVQNVAAIARSVSVADSFMTNLINCIPILSFTVLLAGVIALYQKALRQELVTHTADGMRIIREPEKFETLRQLVFLFICVVEVLLVLYCAYCILIF